MGKTNLNLENASRLRQEMNKQHIFFSYRGTRTHEVMLALLAITEKKMEMDGSGHALRSRVFNVMVECMQSLTSKDEPQDDYRAPVFMIGKEEFGYTIYTGNMVSTGKVRALKSNLSRINTMSPDELKEFNKVLLQSVQYSDGGDAGLSLIDIARKTSNRIDFDFEPLDEDHYFFSLKTTLGKKKNDKPTLVSIYALHRLLEESKIVLSYTGHFNQEFTKSMLTLTERKLVSEDVEDSMRRKIFNIMVEILQNLSKHCYSGEKSGPGYDSAFMIGVDTEQYIMISGNSLELDQQDELKARLDMVNSLDKDGLKKLYKEVRLKGRFSELSGAGIGLIDMARKSGFPLEYDFAPLDEELGYFSMLSRISTGVDQLKK